ncbi:energy transducer TonB [Gaoshiqia sp. Z1-71]|uniref:energy transducer TonB n=1 Tax=Gaoshiqia hydrogeniformans TaxID=3290090 RepID=UPI003BF8B56D
MKNQLSERERNAFERELQKDPFLAEAVEGLASMADDCIWNDLSELKKEIVSGNRRNRRIWWYAAASVLLVVVSSVWLFDLEQKTFQTITHNREERAPETQIQEHRQEPASVQASKEIIADLADDTEEEALLMLEDDEETDPSGRSISQGRSVLTEDVFVQEEQNLIVYELDRSAVRATVGEQKNGFQAPSAGSLVRLPDVADTSDLTLKGIALTDDHSESFLRMGSGLEPALDEVVIVGYGNQKKAGRTGAVSSVVPDREAIPLVGWEQYRTYLDQACRNVPVDSSKKKIVVKMTFVVSVNGLPEQIEILRSDDQTFDREAIRIVQHGGLWLPKVKDSVLQAEQVKLRLVFQFKE